MFSLLSNQIGRLRIVGFLEGLSFIMLLGIAMPLKYAAGRPEAVRVIGLIHGILFLLYLFVGIRAAVENRWSWKTTVVLILAALFPFGPFILDAKLLRAEFHRNEATRT
jgi:integral membrane protein